MPFMQKTHGRHESDAAAPLTAPAEFQTQCGDCRDKLHALLSKEINP
jgi:bacterioferritin-associated ferredoxin